MCGTPTRGVCVRTVPNGLNFPPRSQPPDPPLYGGLCAVAHTLGLRRFAGTPHHHPLKCGVCCWSRSRLHAPAPRLLHHAPRGVARARGLSLRDATHTPALSLGRHFWGWSVPTGLLRNARRLLHARYAGLRGNTPDRSGCRLALCARVARYYYGRPCGGQTWARVALRVPRVRRFAPRLPCGTVLGSTSTPQPPAHGGLNRRGAFHARQNLNRIALAGTASLSASFNVNRKISLFVALSRDTLTVLTAHQNHPLAYGLACGIALLDRSRTRSIAGRAIWIALAGSGDTYVATPTHNDILF